MLSHGLFIPHKLRLCLKPLESGERGKKSITSTGFLCPGFVQLVEQRMEFGHCSKLEFLATSGVGFTALLLFWVSAHVCSLNLH